MEDNIISENERNKKSKISRWIFYLAVVLLGIFAIYFFYLSGPKNSVDTIIHIGPGRSLRDITLELEERKVIRQPAILQSVVIFLKNDRQIPVGDYLFKKETNVWHVAIMLAFGIHNINPYKVTFPEGITNKEVTDILEKKIPNFNEISFSQKIKDKQGYLFPDTYFFFPLTTEEEIISALSDNFTHKINLLQKEIESSKYSLEQVIIMASIIEGEADGTGDAPIISGILWKRLEKGMPLQVDVAKETYLKKGLPEKPINNPGLLAIKATLNPTETKYLYYLHDKNGNTHYAVIYAEHQRNIAKYLK